MTTERTEEEQPLEGADEAQAPEDPTAKAERERDEMKAIAQRAQADLLNYKRRTEEERRELARSASHSVIRKLLPIADDLRRAVDALPEDAPEEWAGGARLILQNALALLESEGVTPFEAAPGDPFDPMRQEAVASRPSAEHPAGAVVETVSPGYIAADRPLRAAQVVVSSGPPAGEGGE